MILDRRPAAWCDAGEDVGEESSPVRACGASVLERMSDALGPWSPCCSRVGWRITETRRPARAIGGAKVVPGPAGVAPASRRRVSAPSGPRRALGAGAAMPCSVVR